MRPWSGFWISMGAWLLACAAHAAPCVTPGASCAEWLSLIKGSARILVFRTHPLHERQTDITRALVVVHGAQRDADRYFEHALASASQAGALDSSLVVAVRFVFEVVVVVVVVVVLVVVFCHVVCWWVL